MSVMPVTAFLPLELKAICSECGDELACGDVAEP
jgi:hypothetical protein